MKKANSFILFFMVLITACNAQNANSKYHSEKLGEKNVTLLDYSKLPVIAAGVIAKEVSCFSDSNGDIVPIPKDFYVSKKHGEQTVDTGLVLIGTDGNEFVWIPVIKTTFSRKDYDSYGFYDEIETDEYNTMKNSVETYGGFYIGRYESSKGKDGLVASKKASVNQIWVNISPQNMIKECSKLYAYNSTVTAFLPWGVNWDTTLQWLIDSGAKTKKEVEDDSSAWGNYANNPFGSRDYSATGAYEETKSNNIYDMAGNFWEWTQERSRGGGYAARAGGYSIMGRGCKGNYYPVTIRSGLPGNNHHPNIGFRLALFVQ